MGKMRLAFATLTLLVPAGCDDGGGGVTKACVVDGVSHPVGSSFPSSDGCNTCQCAADLTVMCTARACADTCSAERECSGGQMCFAPGASIGCGICRDPEPSETCTGDGDCTGGAICQPLACACTGGSTCVPGCSSTEDCGLGTVCDAGHRCQPVACAAGSAPCPADFDCRDGHCARRACSASATCDGLCVLGLCYDQPGFCSFLPP